MDFELNDMQRMLVDSAERLMREATDVEKWRARRANPGGLDGDAWHKMAEMGWLALAVPEDAGGLGGSLEDVALLMIEFGRGLAIEPVISTGVLATHLIDRGAEGALRGELLEAIASGELRLALAHAEPADPEDEQGERATRARREGEGWVIDGAKIMALDAPSAHRLLVTATIEGEAGLGIFLVDAQASGLTLDSYPLIDGSHAADLELAGIRVDNAALLASGAAGADLLAEALDRARIAQCAQALGAMEAALAVASEYAKDRKQFGQPIGKFQAIQHMAAQMFAATFEARSALYQALAASGGSPAARAVATSIAKVKVAETSQIVGRSGIQIHGGYGITDEYAISHYYRRLLSLEKQYGDIDAHLRRIVAAG